MIAAEYEADENQPWSPGARPQAAPLSARQLTDYSDEPGYAIRPGGMAEDGPPPAPAGPAAYCPRCAASGVGACDDYPDCPGGRPGRPRFGEDEEES